MKWESQYTNFPAPLVCWKCFAFTCLSRTIHSYKQNKTTVRHKPQEKNTESLVSMNKTKQQKHAGQRFTLGTKYMHFFNRAPTRSQSYRRKRHTKLTALVAGKKANPTVKMRSAKFPVPRS